MSYQQYSTLNVYELICLFVLVFSRISLCGLLAAVVYFFFLVFLCLISEVTEWISAKLGHIFTYDCYFKHVVRNSQPQAFSPMGWGAKKRFSWDRLQSLTDNVFATEHDINHRKETRRSTGTPLQAAKYCKLWSTNRWERLASFAHP